MCVEFNFLLYIDALSRLVLWFYTLGRTHYARWIPVHLRDMVTLAIKDPSVYTQFMTGNLTVKKTTHAFSAIAIDHAHELNIALVKGDGGAVGLTEKSCSFAPLDVVRSRDGQSDRRVPGHSREDNEEN